MVAEMAEDVILQIAEAYGVRVLFRAGHPNIPHRFQGPMAHGCNPRRRTLYVDSLWEDNGPIEWIFHELVHVIVQPPFWEMNETPEEFMLFQFERALAQACLEDWAYRQVLAWQETTLTDRIGMPALGSIPNYRKQTFWRDGYAFCREVGLLDGDNKVTWERPAWGRLQGIHIDLFLYVTRQAPTRPKLLSETVNEAFAWR